MASRYRGSGAPLLVSSERVRWDGRGGPHHRSLTRTAKGVAAGPLYHRAPLCEVFMSAVVGGGTRFHSQPSTMLACQTLPGSDSASRRRHGAAKSRQRDGPLARPRGVTNGCPTSTRPEPRVSTTRIRGTGLTESTSLDPRTERLSSDRPWRRSPEVDSRANGQSLVVREERPTGGRLSSLLHSHESRRWKETGCSDVRSASPPRSSSSSALGPEQGASGAAPAGSRRAVCND